PFARKVDPRPARLGSTRDERDSLSNARFWEIAVGSADALLLLWVLWTPAQNIGRSIDSGAVSRNDGYRAGRLGLASAPCRFEQVTLHECEPTPRPAPH